MRILIRDARAKYLYFDKEDYEKRNAMHLYLFPSERSRARVIKISIELEKRHNIVYFLELFLITDMLSTTPII